MDRPRPVHRGRRPRPRAGGAGGTVLRVPPHEDDWPERVAAHVSREPTCRGVVWLSAPAEDGTAACSPVAGPLRLVQALPASATRLFLVTSGAQSVHDKDATTDPFAASLWGFGRAAAAERPELRCRLVDLDSDAFASTGLLPAGVLADELTHDGLEEVALRGGDRYERALERAGPVPRCTT
ncbi:hypothetical protein NKH77_44740 [Streptomyces sp. M19]